MLLDPDGDTITAEGVDAVRAWGRLDAAPDEGWPGASLAFVSAAGAGAAAAVAGPAVWRTFMTDGLSGRTRAVLHRRRTRAATGAHVTVFFFSKVSVHKPTMLPICHGQQKSLVAPRLSLPRRR